MLEGILSVFLPTRSLAEAAAFWGPKPSIEAMIAPEMAPGTQELGSGGITLDADFDARKL